MFHSAYPSYDVSPAYEGMTLILGRDSLGLFCLEQEYECFGVVESVTLFFLVPRGKNL